MQKIFDFADELGPAKVVHLYEPSINLRAVLVIDNVAKGPAIGGIRMASDVTTEECFRLARAMTMKNAAAGLPHGGGKVVLYGDPKMEKGEKERLIRGLANMLRDTQEYILAPDMGTDEECMAWIEDEIGRVVGLPREVGGIPLDEIGATGWGLSQAAEVAMEFCDFELSGARIVVQGFGAVGKHSARFLVEKGAILVGVADSGGAVENPDGLDIDTLIQLKEAGRGVTDYPGATPMDRDAVVGIECELWIPAARPDVVNEENVSQLNAQMVIEGANIPITLGAEQNLHERGVICIPDFIANAGGVICAAMEYQNASQAAAFQTIREKIRRNTRMVLEQSRQEGILPRKAAEEIALQRVHRAMEFRRWMIF